MVALWYLLILAPFIALPILWWNYRRKQAARERLAGERWQQIISKPAAGDENAVAAASAPMAPTPQLQYRRRERLLDPSRTLMYYLLRSGLPECEVLVQVSLDRLLAPAAEMSDRTREKYLQGLAQHSVDFVVCDKAMQPLAAVELLEQEAPAALTTETDFSTQCLAHSGIRHVRIARTALPKRQEVRAVVLGL